MRWQRAAPWIVALCALGCTDHIRPLEIALNFDPEDPTIAGRTTELELLILRGGCDATDVAYSATIPHGEQVVEAPMPLSSGVYGISATAFARPSCEILSEICRDVTLPYGERLALTLLALPSPRSTCAAPGRCIDGVCIVQDGAVPCMSAEIPCNGLDDDCNAVVDDGMREFLDTSVEHCGSCNNPCGVPSDPNAEPVCRGAVCGEQCRMGFTRCLTGCEDLSTSEHCGACGTACDTATPDCIRADGGYTCDTCPYTVCMTSSGRRCIDTSSDPNFCGGCMTDCTMIVENDPAVACVDGACVFSGTCEPGFADCDANAANGCESNTSTSAINCGACGLPCDASTIANATEVGCMAGVCTPTACATGHGTCAGWPTECRPWNRYNCYACGCDCTMNIPPQLCNVATGCTGCPPT